MHMPHAQASIAAAAVLITFGSNVVAQAGMPYIGLDSNGNLHVDGSEPPCAVDCFHPFPSMSPTSPSTTPSTTGAPPAPTSRLQRGSPVR